MKDWLLNWGPVRQALTGLKMGLGSKVDDSRWCRGEGGESALCEASVELIRVLFHDGQINQLHDHQLVQEHTHYDGHDEPTELRHYQCQVVHCEYLACYHWSYSQRCHPKKFKTSVSQSDLLFTKLCNIYRNCICSLLIQSLIKLDNCNQTWVNTWVTFIDLWNTVFYFSVFLSFV